MPTPRRLILPAADVAAVRAGAKTQHRVPVTGEPSRVYWNPVVVARYGGWVDEHGRPTPCPLGKVGDLIWLAEAWHTDTGDLVYARAQHEDCMSASPIFYKLDPVNRNAGCTWRPAAQMPRWASRTTLQITDVRVQKLQDISEADAIAEGAPCYVCGGPLDGRSESDCHCFHRKATVSDFRVLWDSRNAKRTPWDSNPFVFAISFRRV